MKMIRCYGDKAGVFLICIFIVLNFHSLTSNLCFYELLKHRKAHPFNVCNG
jgi:hypothetical protein